MRSPPRHERKSGAAPFRFAAVLAPLLVALLCAVPLAPALAKIVIGVAGPTEGPGVAATREIADAARRAAARFNEKGGVAGDEVEIVEADDACAVEGGEAAARSLIEKKAVLVLGHPCASAAIAAAKVYAGAGVLFLASATRHRLLTDPRAGPTIFRVGGRDDRQGQTAGQLLAKLAAGKPVAIVHDTSLIADRLSGRAAAALKDAGVTQVTVVEISSGQKDFTKVIAKIGGTGLGALFFAGQPIEAGLLLNQMRAAGVMATFIGCDTLASPQFSEIVGDTVSGAGVLLPADAAREPLPSAREAFGPALPPGTFLEAYAAVQAWQAAAESVRSTAAAQVAPALQGGKFETVIGPLSFDANGDAATASYDLVWWKDGVLALRN
jgi:branched-chain amino acid transport system substrate-binding protein